ncbi:MULTISPECIES: hypothetical protein [unclassified Leptolyngbya]|uniref:hypothetical protein n=1 Tax=unclassified Leptolyngbya TaxID=2650499 RepID=UPI00168633A0|nr:MULTISPECIES: hypothetical protein [unclassified Leptolyngbya]MBD1912731.1 hypothetical protein [Leptolyngbya sp. FACHB-8]MBD2155755.1 hypothetical protein [Leptolyngbya sp. FACHB-16]
MKPSSGSNSLPTNPIGGPNQNASGAATVPLKVYRELAAELQATKAMLDSLHGQNQQLTQQNQQMRQDMERLVQTALTLQQYMPGGTVPAGNVLQSFPSDAARTQAEALAAQIRPHRAATSPASSSSYLPDSDDSTNPLLTSQPIPAFTPSQGSSSRDINGLWLWLIVIGIIATAFGAGFLLVKPLLPSSR